jgi:hypothetical protein
MVHAPQEYLVCANVRFGPWTVSVWTKRRKASIRRPRQEPSPRPTRMVPTDADLNVSKPEGAATLYARIQQAARRVCLPLDGGEVSSKARMGAWCSIGERGDRYVSPYNVARIYGAIDDKARALEWLERAYQEHNPDLIELTREPSFARLHSDAKFRDLARRIWSAWPLLTD